MKETGCCPIFEPKQWDGVTHHWNNKMFLHDSVFQLFHIPLTMGTVVKRMFAKIEAVHAAPETKDFLMLCYDPSPWKSDLYMTVTKRIPDGEMATLSGVFVSKVFDGPYNAVPKWITEMDAYLAREKKKALKYYIHYAYCPKCAKAYGHNYAIVFAKISE